MALLNVFNKISMSVDTYYKNRKEAIALGHEQKNYTWLQLYTYFGSFLGLFLLIISAKANSNPELNSNKKDE